MYFDREGRYYRAVRTTKLCNPFVQIPRRFRREIVVILENPANFASSLLSLPLVLATSHLLAIPTLCPPPLASVWGNTMYEDYGFSH